jgi:hypothetical protein
VSDAARRIEREAGVAVEALAALAPSELRSLLLEVTRAHAQRSPADVLAQYERDRTVLPEPTDARTLHALRGRALDAAADFEALELAPVAPLATNAALGGIDQNNVLSTTRNSEVLADPTSALALECAVRRRRGGPTVRLCALQRVIRMQAIEDKPGLTPHFLLLALVSAGRGPSFARDELVAHVRVYQRLLPEGRVEFAHTRLTPADGPIVKAMQDGPSELVDTPPADAPGILHELAEALPEARFDLLRRQGLGYYDGPMLRFSAGGYALADGGLVDWTQRMLSNRKERLLISGFGLGLMAARFADRGLR